MSLLGIDHMVLTVGDIDASVAFYEVLGMERQTFGEGRIALCFGRQKINLHRAKGETASPRADSPGTGTADFCLIDSDLAQARRRLEDAGIAIELGPVARTGAAGPIRSIYCRDPDGNLVEIAAYEET
ncbi:biphenyl-2,3-diol 1,2-dioxygenase III-related protein [hydrothermal vent metagenome]|uniref:Biphenyl-2,3-diol 1,2-dioxygenase III-related protein n=1 Tax=hydrothermal vent metagenome TaxID=652676 RepID=A0A3B0TWF2_9ZZZZ